MMAISIWPMDPITMIFKDLRVNATTLVAMGLTLHCKYTNTKPLILHYRFIHVHVCIGARMVVP